MAVKTKQMVQNELDAAQKKLEKFEKLPELLNDYIARYGVDVCDDGLREFVSEFGLEWSNPKPASVTITISGFELNATGSGYYVELDSDDLYTKVEKALKTIPEFATTGIYIDQEYQED